MVFYFLRAINIEFGPRIGHGTGQTNKLGMAVI